MKCFLAFICFCVQSRGLIRPRMLRFLVCIWSTHDFEKHLFSLMLCFKYIAFFWLWCYYDTLLNLESHLGIVFWSLYLMLWAEIEAPIETLNAKPFRWARSGLVSDVENTFSRDFSVRSAPDKVFVWMMYRHQDEWGGRVVAVAKVMDHTSVSSSHSHVQSMVQCYRVSRVTTYWHCCCLHATRLDNDVVKYSAQLWCIVLSKATWRRLVVVAVGVGGLKFLQYTLIHLQRKSK